MQDHALLFRYHQPEIRCFHHGFQLAVIKQPRLRQLHSLRYRVADPLRQEEQCFRLGIPLEIPGMAEQIPGSPFIGVFLASELREQHCQPQQQQQDAQPQQIAQLVRVAQAAHNQRQGDQQTQHSQSPGEQHPEHAGAHTERRRPHCQQSAQFLGALDSGDQCEYAQQPIHQRHHPPEVPPSG